MKKFLNISVSLLLILTAFITPTSAIKGNAINWYTTRNKEHKQALVPQELAQVENYGGIYIDHRFNDTNEEKVVYLTFDVGYENGNVERIVSTLEETETTGAFFVLKHFVTESSDLLRRIAQNGNLICNHTAHHKNLSNAKKEEIVKEIKELEDAVAEVTGSGTKPYFRPPEGCFSLEMLDIVRSIGYKTVFWSLAYADWDNERQPSPDEALEKLLCHMHNGAVILLHPTSSTNAEILPRLINTLKNQGYRFGSLDELCFAR